MSIAWMNSGSIFGSPTNQPNYWYFASRMYLPFERGTQPMRILVQEYEQYVAEGGHMFVEARAGWQDEKGHGQPIIPGFGWHKMAGVRETQTLPAKTLNVQWGDAKFAGMSFQEEFEQLDPAAKVVAKFENGVPAKNVPACSTCHCYVKKGLDSLTPAEEREEDGGAHGRCIARRGPHYLPTAPFTSVKTSSGR